MVQMDRPPGHLRRNLGQTARQELEDSVKGLAVLDSPNKLDARGVPGLAISQHVL